MSNVKNTKLQFVLLKPFLSLSCQHCLMLTFSNSVNLKTF